MDALHDLLSIPLHLVFYVVSTGACIVFLHCFYDPDFLWTKKKALLLTAVYFADYAWYIVLDALMVTDTFSLPFLTLLSGISDLLFLVLECWIVFYDFKGKRLRGLLRYFWVSFIIILCATLIEDIGSIYLFPGYDITSMEISYTIVYIQKVLEIGIFSTIFFYLYYRIYKKNILLRFQKREKIFAVVYSLICIAFEIIIKQYGVTSHAALIGLGATFIIAAIMIPIFFYYLQISGHYQTRTKLQEAHLEAELAHFQQYQRNQEETARFRHDIRNNLICVNDMLDQGKTEEASAYLKDLLDVVNNLSRKYVTGDPLLDSIVGVKAQIMEQHGIQFELDGVLAGGLPWKPMDVCNVFANALDNAIEACQKVNAQKRKISMQIKATTQFWFVILENPVDAAVDTSRLFQKHGGYTSKSDKAHHGIGTYNMKTTVEAYNAMLHAECHEDTFRLEIMIDKSHCE